jgi:hypothetical protein
MNRYHLILVYEHFELFKEVRKKLFKVTEFSSDAIIMKIEQNKSMFKHFKNISRNIFGKYLKG